MKTVITIGETSNLFKRLSSHIEEKQGIKSISFATKIDKLNTMDKEEIKDLESLLIGYASDHGLKLQNKKDEKRKVKI